MNQSAALTQPRSQKQLRPRTCGPSPSGDAAGVVGLKQLGGPGNADGAHRRIVLETFLLEGKLLHLHQSDVVLVAAGVVPAGEFRNVM